VLPGRPPFECRSLVIGGETLELHFRNILACIRSIYSDPEFAQDLAVAPERHYADQERRTVYSEMYTGDWWWAVQVRKLFYTWNSSKKSIDRRPLNQIDRAPRSSQ
jgi:hypothetical protein